MVNNTANLKLLLSAGAVRNAVAVPFPMRDKSYMILVDILKDGKWNSFPLEKHDGGDREFRSMKSIFTTLKRLGFVDVRVDLSGELKW